MTSKQRNMCGYRLLPQLVDHIAATEPQKVHSYVYSSSPRHLKVTYRCLARAVDRLATSLTTSAQVKGEFVAIIGCSDLRSVIFFLASIKAGCTVCIVPSVQTSHC